MKKKIILTGGGTAGHVVPNLALVPALRAAGYEIYYIGRKNGIERTLVEAEGLPYHGISAGKLRRYVDFKNFTDIFRVVKGFADALRVIRKIKPDVIFSKGGFVTVPVLAAARFLRIKSIIHESDITPGLANRLAIPFASKVCASFPETMQHLPKEKAVLTGSPIRQSLLGGNAAKARELCKFANATNPTILVMGGSTGAKAINQCLREALPALTPRYNIIHLCGKGNRAEIKNPAYAEFEYVNEEMPHLYAAASLVVSRAGANSIFELIALKKPNLLIPLPRSASRGDQIENAASMQSRGLSQVLEEEGLTPDVLERAIDELYKNRQAQDASLAKAEIADGVANVMGVIVGG